MGVSSRPRDPVHLKIVRKCYIALAFPQRQIATGVAFLSLLYRGQTGQSSGEVH